MRGVSAEFVPPAPPALHAPASSSAGAEDADPFEGDTFRATDTKRGGVNVLCADGIAGCIGMQWQTI